MLKKGFREEFSNNGTAKKLLVLARELGRSIELSDIKNIPLLPSQLDEPDLKSKFSYNTAILNKHFEIAKMIQLENHVLRCVGEISIPENKFEVKLISEPVTSVIGQLKGLETVFEIYTQSRGNIPIVVKREGSGNKALDVARGILTDILKDELKFEGGTGEPYYFIYNHDASAIPLLPNQIGKIIF